MILLLGALAALSTPARAALVDKIAATVNGEVILLSDIARFEKTLTLRKELDPLFGFSEELESGKLTRPKALEFLIQERLITQNLKVTDEEVDQEIQTVQRNNNLDRERLLDFLAAKGYAFEEYRELMRVGLSKRNLLDREIRNRVNISDDDKRNYYFNNMAAKDGKSRVEYSIQLIVVSPRSYKTPKAAEQAAEDGLRAIRQGESFAEVAKRISDDPSAPQGGELGYLSPDVLFDALRGVVRKLQIGEVSDIFKGPNGFTVVKVLGKKSTESDDFKEKENAISEILAKEEYKKQLFLWAERARNSAYVHVNPI